MHVKNVLIENAVLQADEGIDIQEASDITLNNITIIPRNTNPVAYILNSDNITIYNLKYKNESEVLAQVQGDRTKDIFILNTDVFKAKQKLVTGFGTTESVVNWIKTVPVEIKKTMKDKKSRRHYYEKNCNHSFINWGNMFCKRTKNSILAADDTDCYEYLARLIQYKSRVCTMEL